MSTAYRDGYSYNPATASYYIDKRPSHPPPPPIPPKELEAGAYNITKETHHGFAELEGDSSDVGRLSLDDKSATSSRGGERPRKKEKRKDKGAKPAKIATPVKTKRKLRILSLDGGGIRGYSILVILGELMHQIYVQTHNGKGPKSPSELPRPCDYFDIIGGTGTGGLIALMLGRMRMDIESCKEYYVELTRYVFITDKTVMGVPYGKTLFKSSRLEDAIKHCVRESTRFDFDKIIPHSPPPPSPPPSHIKNKRTNSWRGRRSSSHDSGEQTRGRRGSPSNPSRRTQGQGNAEAPLLDTRPGACKTFVTAVYKGTPPNSSNPPALLRTYPSRGESVPSYNCTIWQAGRATSATLSAFKPITVGQNTFLDEGSGRYNPAQQVLEEAHLHEYPDDEISVFISIGTGKRPDGPTPASNSRHHHSHAHSTGERQPWWEGIIATPFEDFTEARRKLMAKLDDCERVHRALIDPEDGGRPGLAKMGVSREDYYRFNVEVGVGEFALNEWNRLADVSTNTRRYLGMRETAKLVRECAGKMVMIEKLNNPDTALTPMRPTFSSSSSSSFNSPPPLPNKELDETSGIAELSAEIQRAEAEWTDVRQKELVHPSQRPFSPIEQIVQYPVHPAEQPLFSPPPAPPPKPPKVGKPLYPEEETGIHYQAVMNPEIRVTSPTTVAGEDSEDERERRKIAEARRRRRSRSGSTSRRR